MDKKSAGNMAIETLELEENPDVFISYSSATKSAYTSSTKGKPSMVQPDDLESITADDVALWGTKNDFPQQIEKHIESNPDLANVLQYKALKLYSY
jgi:hypothetical protein